MQLHQVLQLKLLTLKLDASKGTLSGTLCATQRCISSENRTKDCMEDDQNVSHSNGDLKSLNDLKHHSTDVRDG